MRWQLPLALVAALFLASSVSLSPVRAEDAPAKGEKGKGDFKGKFGKFEKGKGGFKGGFGKGGFGKGDGAGKEAFLKKFDKNGDGKIDDAEKQAIREAFGKKDGFKKKSKD